MFCPVHLPGQNIFFPGQNQICPRQNDFVNDKIFFVHDKNFVHSLKIIFALGKLISSHGQNFCPGQKIFCPRQNYFVQDKSDFVLDEKHFVQANGQGIRCIFTLTSIFNVENFDLGTCQLKIAQTIYLNTYINCSPYKLISYESDAEKINPLIWQSQEQVFW